MLLFDDLRDGATLQLFLVVQWTEFPALISPEYPSPIWTWAEVVPSFQGSPLGLLPPSLSRPRAVESFLHFASASAHALVSCNISLTHCSAPFKLLLRAHMLCLVHPVKASQVFHLRVSCNLLNFIYTEPFYKFLNWYLNSQGTRLFVTVFRIQLVQGHVLVLGSESSCWVWQKISGNKYMEQRTLCSRDN